MRGLDGGKCVKVQDAIDRLLVLGFRQPEAAIYVHLSIVGPRKASEVASGLRMRRTEAYRILEALVKKGHVRTILGRPVRFEALSPETVFDQIFESREAQWERIVNAREETISMLSALRSRSVPEAGISHIRVLQGRPEAYEAMEHMINGSQREVRIVTTHGEESFSVDAAGIWELLVRRAYQGLESKIVLRAGQNLPERLAHLMENPKIEIRRVSEDRTIRFAVSDRREVLVWAGTDPSNRLRASGDIVLWTDAEDMINTQLALFDRLWSESRPAEARPEAETGRLPRTELSEEDAPGPAPRSAKALEA